MKIKVLKLKKILSCSTRNDAGKTHELENFEISIPMDVIKLNYKENDIVELLIHHGDCRINHATTHDVKLTMTRDEFKTLVSFGA